MQWPWFSDCILHPISLSRDIHVRNFVNNAKVGDRFLELDTASSCLKDFIWMMVVQDFLSKFCECLFEQPFVLLRRMSG